MSPRDHDHDRDGDRDDGGIDARLRAALRHAPDRDLAPPAALDRRILDAASEAVRSQRAAASTGWRGWLDTLTRPAGAAALAGVVLATVIGVMWQDGPPPDAPAETLSDRKADAPVVAAAPTAPAGESRGPAPAPAPAAAAPAPPAAATLPPPPARMPAPERAKAAPAVAPAAPAPSPAQAPAPVDNPAVARATAEAAASPARPSPAPPPIAAAPPPPPAPPRSDAAEAAARPRSEAPSSLPRAMSAPPRSADRSMAAAFDPMLAALAASEPASADAALLRELQQAVAGRWQAVMAPERLPTFSQPPLRLRDGAGTLHLEAGTVYWIAPDGDAWRGALRTDAAPLLRERLAQPR